MTPTRIMNISRPQSIFHSNGLLRSRDASEIAFSCIGCQHCPQPLFRHHYSLEGDDGVLLLQSSSEGCSLLPVTATFVARYWPEEYWQPYGAHNAGFRAIIDVDVAAPVRRPRATSLQPRYRPAGSSGTGPKAGGDDVLVGSQFITKLTAGQWRSFSVFHRLPNRLLVRWLESCRSHQLLRLLVASGNDISHCS